MEDLTKKQKIQVVSEMKVVVLILGVMIGMVMAMVMVGL